MFDATPAVYLFLERAASESEYGVDAYARGLRIVHKVPQLSDGRTLSSGLMWFINVGTGLAWIVMGICYTLVFSAVTGFPADLTPDVKIVKGKARDPM